MLEMLQAKLEKVMMYLEEANYHYDISGISYYQGQRDVLNDLINHCNEVYYSNQEDAYNSYSYDEAEFEENNPYYYFSDIDKYLIERRDLIEEQTEDAHNTLHFTRGLGKSVINSDSYWFTSDEIEAFRVIWQRRISAM
jgi:hypothetical protein